MSALRRVRRSTLLVVALLILAVIPSANAVIAVPTFGAPTTSTTTDFQPSVVAVDTTSADSGAADPWAILMRWDAGTLGDSSDDCYYIHFGLAADTKVVAGDLRIGGGATSSCTAGQIIKTSDTEIASSITMSSLGDVRTFIKHLDLDGKKGLSDGDLVYIDIPNSVPGCGASATVLSVCDLRLVTRTVGSSLAFGTAVKAGNGDLAEAADADGVLPDTTTLVDPTEANIEIHHYDANENQARDASDTLYLRITDGSPGSPLAACTSACPATLVAGAFVPFSVDIRLTAFGSLAAGTVVKAADADHIPTLEAPSAPKILRVAGSSTAEDRLFLHWTASTSVQYGDLALNTVTGQTAGALATSAATGVGLSGTLSAETFASQVFWVDTNSNGRFDDADGLYLNRPASIGGSAGTDLSANDVRLKAVTVSTAYAAGTVVAAGNGDLVAHTGTGNANQHTLKWYDGDRSQSLQTLRNLANAKVSGADGALDAADSAYVEDANLVESGSVRISLIEFAEASAVAAGNADLGGSVLTELSNVKISGGDGAFAGGEFAYIDADGTGTVTTGDTRITAVAGSGAAGSVVAGGDADQVAATALTATTNKDYVTGTDSTWDKDNEYVYTDNDATTNTHVAAGLLRVTPVGGGLASGSAVVGGEIDLLRPFRSLAGVKITGGDGTFALGEDAYISADNVVSTGDIRITSVGGFAAGSTVAGTDSDAVAATALTAPTNPAYITGQDATFTAGTDVVYLAAAAPLFVAAGHQRVTPISLASGSTATCPANPDCGAPLQALTNARVTGTDGTWTSSSETVYVSADEQVAAGDIRVSPLTLNNFVKTTAAAVVASDADEVAHDIGTGDALYLSRAALTGTTSASKIPLLHDVRLLHTTLAYGSLVQTSATDFTPRYLPLGNEGELYRWDKGVAGTFNDDVFWAHPATGGASPTTPVAGDVRLLKSLTQPVGTAFTNGHDDATASLVKDTADSFEDRVCFVTPSGSQSSGYDSKDFVYIDNPFFAGSGAGALSQNDLRITATTGLTTNYNAGTIVAAGDSDRFSFTTCSSDPLNGRSFQLKFLDQNFDAAYTGGITDNTRMEHLLISADATACAAATPCSMILLPGDIHLTGGAVATSGASGGAPPTSTTTSTSTSTTATSTTTATGTATTTVTGTSSPTPTLTDVASWNQAIAEGLNVVRGGSSNTLNWPPQSGASGYQVFRADSPYQSIATINDGTSGRYVDDEGTIHSTYLVTAFAHVGSGTVGQLSDPNVQDVPGRGVAPEGARTEEGPQEPVPAAGLVFALAALAAAFVMRRRL